MGEQLEAGACSRDAAAEGDDEEEENVCLMRSFLTRGVVILRASFTKHHPREEYEHVHLLICYDAEAWFGRTLRL